MLLAGYVLLCPLAGLLAGVLAWQIAVVAVHHWLSPEGD